MHRGPKVAWNSLKKSFHRDKPTKAIRTQLEKALPRLLVLLLACFPSSVVWLFSFCLVHCVSLHSAGSCAAAAEGCSMRTVHSVPLLDTWEAASSCKLQVQTHRQTTVPPPSREDKHKDKGIPLPPPVSLLLSPVEFQGHRGPCGPTASIIIPLHVFVCQLILFQCFSVQSNIFPVCPCFLFSFCIHIFYGNFSPLFSITSISCDQSTKPPDFNTEK